MTRPRRVALLGALLAVPVIAVSMAYACVSLAIMSLDTTAGPIGTTVTGTGKGFSGMMGAVSTNVPAQPAPVEIHFGTRSGPVLWTGTPDSQGKISFSFQIPESQAGETVIFATQYNANGTAVSGTPARASFTVTAPPAPPAPTQEAVVESSAAAAPAPAPAATATPAPAPAPARVRVAPRASDPRPAPAAAPAPAPAPAAVAPSAEASPAPVPAPADVGTPPAPARRSVMVSMVDDSGGSSVLAIALVGIGLVLAFGASALVLAGRREAKVRAGAHRS